MDLRDWWRRVVSGLEIQPTSPEADVKLQLKTLLGDVEVGAKQSSATRDTLKFQINQQMPELIRRLDWVIKEAQEIGQRKLLIVVEGLDKVDLESASSIFRDHAPTITAPQVTMIYTFPIALRHSDHFNTIHLSFPELCYFPNVPLRHADGTENVEAGAALRRLVLTRMEEPLIAPDALDLLVKENGASRCGWCSWCGRRRRLR